jgi:hypothetical protein
MKWKSVPDVSERRTRTILLSGSEQQGLVATNAGSFHRVI